MYDLDGQFRTQERDDRFYKGSIMYRMMIVAWVMGLVAVGAVNFSTPARADDQGGTVLGVLVAKGPSSVKVKGDDQKEPVEYRAPWIGGGPDQAVVAQIKALVLPNRVKLVWKTAEGPRIVSVAMILPAQKTGTMAGGVTAVGKEWFELEAGDGTLNRFWPRWIGGLPKDGGGLDKVMLGVIAGLKVGDAVAVNWMFDERLRATSVSGQEDK